jgi:hypothetical protein
MKEGCLLHDKPKAFFWLQTMMTGLAEWLSLLQVCVETNVEQTS